MDRKWAKCVIFISILLFGLLVPQVTFAQVIDPQYMFVRKNPMNCNPGDCRYLWNMDDPSKINAAAISEITSKIGTGNSTNTRKVGIGITFNYWIGDFNKHKESLSKLLQTIQEQNIPIFINFEGLGWLDKRPDLWNWFNPSLPGYNPENVKNVEWTCWESTCAIQKAWRNWGSEFEVKPEPNIASDTVIKATKDATTEFLKIVVDWYKLLRPDQKYLLGGISLGGEVDIGANYYYYPNGINNGKGLKGSVQIGFNAVKTAGIKSSGIITTNDINTVVQRYQTALNKNAYELGIPRNKIFNHNGGKGAAPFIEYPDGVAFESLEGSLNTYAQPGWSFYGDVTANPQNYPDLGKTLDQIGNTQWSSPEWLSWAGDYAGWVTSLRGTLNYRNNRFINVANWEDVKDKQYVIDAIKTVASENPSCWVTEPDAQISVNGNTATISWKKGDHNDAVYLNVTTVGDLTVSGVFKTVNTANAAVTNVSSHNLSNLAKGTYHWILAADGCSNQRRLAYGSFQISGGGSTPPPAPTSTTAPIVSTGSLSEESMIPFWQGTTMRNEAMMPIYYGAGNIYSTLLFSPAQILSVKNAELTKSYIQGKDWIVEGNKLKLPVGSSIPFIMETVASTPDMTLAPDYFQKRQLAVTYTHSGIWNGPKPQYASTGLPNTISKLTKREPLKIVLYGDSISVGYNSSGVLNLAPLLPNWGNLFVDALKRKYQSAVTLINSSEVSKMSAWGIQNVKSRVSDLHPDLVIIAFGMNDGVNMPPTFIPIDTTAYKNNILGIITNVRSTNPKAEFILISPILMHPAYAGSTQGSYQAVLTQLAQTGVTVVDMTSVHKELLKTKTYVDVSGNNINHPNDFMARWYAQEVAGLFIPPITVVQTTTAPSVDSAVLAGDVNADKHVNDTDYSLIVAGYGKKYTMFDYNQMVENYGK